MLNPLQITCSRPFYELLADAVNNPQNLFDWVFCPYTITGLGLTGVGLIVLATGFIGIKNWSESWTLPVTWLAIMGPVLAVSMLPGTVLLRIFGAIVLGVAMALIGAYYWWGRS